MKNLPNCVRTALPALLALVVSLNQVSLNQSANAVEVPRVFAAAQSASTPLVAPPPSQIASAHTIFLTNSAADANFPIDPTKGFNDAYAALQSWNYYKLVGSPAQADLIFQLHEIAPITDVTGGRGVYSVASPAFQLNILDPKTNISLWTITSPVNIAGRKQTRERWTSIAEANLISRIKTLAGQPLSATETADLTTVPRNHFSRTGWVAVGAVAAAGLAAGLILHHEYENGLANQKAAQDAFCEANHIPLSECAGG